MSSLRRKSILISLLTFLSLPLSITSNPASPSPSPSHSQVLSTRSTPLCATPNPTLPLWIVYEWSTDFSTPGAQVVMFLLENSLTGYNVLCLREGPYPEGQCTRVVEKGGEGEEEDTAGTIFSYNELVGVLEVYQEWDCDGGEGGGVMKRMQADGKVTVLEQCAQGGDIKKDEICGKQGLSGEIYANKVLTLDG